ncbi:Maf family protein [Paenibacillus sp. GCM10012306]|uniref:Maf family protein n=1 Tax=Paenibacillus sp. GCM10012306 TaxID=3317342 RepID=UPI003614EA26
MSIVNPKTIILASSSPRRQELIASLNLPYEVIVSDVDETTEPGLSPAEIVEQLSHRKAQAVYERCVAESRFETGGVIVGSDTIVVLDDNVLGKPKDAEDAFRMLQSLQGRKHHVYSGVAVIDMKTDERYTAAGESLDHPEANETITYLGETGQYRVTTPSATGQSETIVGHTVSQITFRPMSDEEIWAYINTGEPLDKAGSYGIQGIGSVFVERIEGDFYSVMGLPLNLLYPILLKFGLSPFQMK